MMQSQKGGSVWWSLWRTVTTFLIMPALFLFCLIAGWVAMKGGLPSTQTGSNAAGTSLPVTPPASTTFAPKEYNKVSPGPARTLNSVPVIAHADQGSSCPCTVWRTRLGLHHCVHHFRPNKFRQRDKQESVKGLIAAHCTEQSRVKAPELGEGPLGACRP